MKKCLSLILSLCVILSSCLVFTSCKHTCSFDDKWTADSSYHWRACTEKNCAETSDKSEHVWDDGVITTPATQEKDGVRTFTCTTCSNTKNEAIVFEGLSEDEWNKAISATLADKFSYTETSVTTGSGISVETKAIYKFTKSSAWVSITAAGQTQSEFVSDISAAITLRKQLIKSIEDLAAYVAYQYDPQTKTYKAVSNVIISSLNASTTDVSLRFVDGKLAEIKYSISFVQGGKSFTATSTVTIEEIDGINE